MNEFSKNDNVPAELKAIVERAVRPLQASLARKRRMREELLAQIVSIYDEELGKLGDDRAALKQSKRRFGDPRELSDNLGRTIPWWNRFLHLVEGMRYDPGESLWHFAGKHLLIHVLTFSTAIPLVVLPILLVKGRLPDFGTLTRIVLVLAVVLAGFSSAFTFLIDRISRALWGSAAERSPRTAVLYGLAALLIPPVMIVLIYGGLGLGLPEPFSPLLAGAAAPLMPGLLVLIAQQAANEIEYEEQWTKLEISD
jgi:hypothetical protein